MRESAQLVLDDWNKMFKKEIEFTNFVMLTNINIKMFIFSYVYFLYFCFYF